MSREETEYRLCGGILLDLILQAKKPRQSARSAMGGSTDAHSDTMCAMNMIKILYPDYNDKRSKQLGQNLTAYRQCTTSSSINLPFKDEDVLASFRKRFEENAGADFGKYIRFIDTFINISSKGRWLVNAVLDVIESDTSISDDEKFRIAADGSYLTKREMLQAPELCFQSFLFGVWAFVMLERTDNEVGRDTYLSWFEEPDTKGNPWVFVSDVGKNDRDFKLSYYDRTESASTKKAVTYKPIDEYVYGPYIESVLDRFGTIKTLLYKDEAKPFYDFYVCNDLERQMTSLQVSNGGATLSSLRLQDVDVAGLVDYCPQFMIISGTGGLGKSMMMRHLLLDAAKNYQDIKLVPIFVPLKDYSDAYESLLDYVYEKFTVLGIDVDIDLFKGSLLTGQFIILLDGLDEIASDYRGKFENDLDHFSNRFRKNHIILSSRPYTSFVQFNRYVVFRLRPFEKEQALKLIDKLDFRPDEPDIKNKFKDVLSRQLFFTHKAFTENPLLLTIMLMTFEQYAEIPSHMYVFYREAYEALSIKHDASKGAYKRPLRTGLSADQFSVIFAEFCARTYMEEKYELTIEQMNIYFDQLKSKDKFSVGKSFDASDFIYDLTANMCLMFYEDNKYQFTHRSFQEYFCAFHFSKAKPEKIRAAGLRFEYRKNSYQDKTFSMLYDMIPEKIEEYVFIPFLENFFEKYNIDEGYHDYLKAMYPYIRYIDGESDGIPVNMASSYIFEFILSTKHLHKSVARLDFPFYEENVEDEIIRVDILLGDPEDDDAHIETFTLTRDEYEDNPSIENVSEPEVVGKSMALDVHEILEDPEGYKELIEFWSAEDFPLKQEYRNAQKWLADYKRQIKERQEDLFDLF